MAHSGYFLLQEVPVCEVVIGCSVLHVDEPCS